MAQLYLNSHAMGDDCTCENDKFVSQFELEEHGQEKKPPQKRDVWNKQIEFLLSCIAMSVGLGNIWRFPFSALKNGGGAYVIPYLIVLFIVGKPIYLMEMVIGQFYSRGCIKSFNYAPAMKGVGVGQVMSVFTVSTYYAFFMAVGLRYLVDSFNFELPWGKCDDNWNTTCVPSDMSSNYSFHENAAPSAEIYFKEIVLQLLPDIFNGIGTPILSLTCCLAVSWILIFFTMVKGIKSSGKASYVLAIFPYIILIILFIRAVTLPGAIDGLLIFFTPRWEKMMEASVWFDAVTQVFFSLAVCFGTIVIYSSYNKFDHNLYRDVHIVSVVDTCTSLLAGSSIFAVLGNVKYNTGVDVFAKNEEGGVGIAFISYPDAIAKFDYFPQLFSALFFLMFFILGIGSIVAMISCVMTVIRDKFPKVKNWQAALLVTSVGFSLGLVYVTPGGLHVLNLVDTYAVSFSVFIFAIVELISICWIYGIDRFCSDIEFMLGRKPGLYWRLCWNYITPGIMIVILVYKLANPQIPENFPAVAHVVGKSISVLIILQVPIFMFIAIKNAKGDTRLQKIKNSFRPTNSWGPQDPYINYQYTQHMNDFRRSNNMFGTIKSLIFKNEKNTKRRTEI